LECLAARDRSVAEVYGPLGSQNRLAVAISCIVELTD
jgi:hypothetical protein